MQGKEGIEQKERCVGFSETYKRQCTNEASTGNFCMHHFWRR